MFAEACLSYGLSTLYFVDCETGAYILDISISEPLGRRLKKKCETRKRKDQ